MEYTFKHALTQEVAYNSVLTERRRALHERAARAIEELYRDRLEEHYGDLAHHYCRSGNIEKAVEYLKLRRAAGRAALSQCGGGQSFVDCPRARLRCCPILPNARSRSWSCRPPWGQH